MDYYLRPLFLSGIKNLLDHDLTSTAERMEINPSFTRMQLLTQDLTYLGRNEIAAISQTTVAEWIKV